MRDVAYYRTTMPFVSESFILEQAHSLHNYNALFVCRDLKAPIEADVVTIDALHKYERMKFTLLRQSAVIKQGLIQHKPAIIHAHFLPDAVMIAPIAKKLNIPLIATSHGFDTQMSRWSLFKTRKPTNWQYLLNERSLYKNADAFIAVSQYMRQRMIERGIADSKIFTHYIGVDTEKFQPLMHQGKFILNVSRHVKVKGIDVLLRAFAKVAAIFDWQLVQVGAGTETLQLMALAKELGIEQRVTWLGAQPHADVKRLMQECACYVQASMPDKNGQTEAFGIVLLEAAASGVPVIASRSGGMPEALIDQETGFLFEPGNVDNLAEKLDFVLGQTSEWRNRMGKAGRDFALSLDIRKQAMLLENIYDQIIDRHANC
ncbi:glycosyltransferase [Janthinobacterium sp. B9-8]|uniref:glycosyltransferase n=1 Tax=Janthinobacterium sp. B9-8 TaxID=1236179 RepID=UPI00061D0896|nr:glycosyltransferase [Janthinobacterium sp. B9-8]